MLSNWWGNMGKETNLSLIIVRATQDPLVSNMGMCMSHTNCDQNWIMEDKAPKKIDWR